MVNWACNMTLTTIWDNQTVVHAMPSTKTVHLGNSPSNIICQLGIVTLLYSRHIQLLPTSTTIFLATRYLIHTQAPVQAHDFHMVGHHDEDMKSPELVTVDVKCSLSHCSQS